MKNNQTMRQAVCKMPPLHHSVEGELFDIEKSEVVKWLFTQPGIKQWVFNRVRSTGAIIYCPVGKTWCGKDFDDFGPI